MNDEQKALSAIKEAVTSRRDVLGLLMGSAGAIALAPVALAQTPKGNQASKDDIAGAERILEVDYTDEQRDDVLKQMERFRAGPRAVRALDFDNALPPAPAFDPRLPGRDYGSQSNSAQTKAPRAALPSNKTDIAFAPLTQLSHWVKTRKISSRKLTDIYLKRIQKHAGELECFVTVTAKLARKQADQADREIASGQYRGPLHGIPYGLKDLADTKGIKTTWGTEPFKDRVPESDARVVELLRDAGAVLLGKTTCGALAYGDVWFDGLTRNPWNLEEGSSGSSAGSASATAAGLCGFSIGTETLGSIISPANKCGAVGLRPTFGRVPRRGFMALAWSLDKVGPICRSVEDTALVLAAINAHDVDDPSSIDMGFHYDGTKNAKDLRIGYMPAAFEGDNASATDKAALEAAKSLGWTLIPITLPDLPYDALFPIIRAESGAAFDAFTRSGEVDRMVRKGVTSRGTGWRTARLISAVDYVNMERLRRLVMQEMDKVFQDVDVIIGPNYGQTMLTITNYTGHPQITFPAGLSPTPTRKRYGVNKADVDPTPHNVPHGFSVFANLYQDGNAILVAHALEKALGVATRPPKFST
ncbi:MAG: amidase [Sphingomonadales bacterium]|nr:amidase [Sphingomonadales bacterium]